MLPELAVSGAHVPHAALLAGGSNFSVPLPGGPGSKAGGAAAGFEDELSRTIVDAEDSSAWTLMHRYNKAADLLGQVLAVGRPLFPGWGPLALSAAGPICSSAGRCSRCVEASSAL